MRRFSAFDMTLFIFTIVLVSIGVIAVYTASYPSAMAEGRPFDIAKMQLVYALFGIAVMLFIMLLPMKVIKAVPFFFGVFGIVLLVMLFFWGVEVNGNRNWLEIFGFRFQPSEVMKVCLILVLSKYFAEYSTKYSNLKSVLIAYVIIFIPIGIILAQKDLGTVFIMLLSCSVIFAISGVKLRYWGPILLLMLGAGYLLVTLSHRDGRIEAWRNPFVDSPSSYQPRNALIAIGSGGVFGRGFTKSLQKWHYLPASHNDYIFAIIGEEGGLLFTIVIILFPYAVFIYRGFQIANCAPDQFSAILAASGTAFLAVPAVVNMAVVTNLLPCMGINLPFISYGGTSLIASLLIVGLILNVSRQRAKENQLYRRNVDGNKEFDEE